MEVMISKLGRGSDSEDLKEKIKQLEEENHEHKEMIKMYKDLQNMKVTGSYHLQDENF